MARSPDAVKADIALTRRVIESDLDALHRLVPRRSWLVYAWVAGGVAAGLLLSRAPLVMVIGRGLRIVRVGAALIGMAEILERMLPGGSKREGTLPGLLPKRERMLPGAWREVRWAAPRPPDAGTARGGRPRTRRALSSTRQPACAE
jgi:hypothetical protein